MAGATGLSDERLERLLQAILARTKAWQERCDSDTGWDVEVGSDLAGDDSVLGVHQASQLAQGGLLAAVDNLQALMGLTVEHRTVHAFAPATLVRAVYECACMSVWLLGPVQREERLVRALRWSATDARDQSRTHKEMGDSQHAKQLERRLDRIRQVASQTGVDAKEAVKPVLSSHAVAGADIILKARGETAVLPLWQLTSGYAHGRRWAWLDFSEREELDDRDPNLVNVRHSLSYDRLAAIVTPAYRVVTVGLRLYDERAGRTSG